MDRETRETRDSGEEEMESEKRNGHHYILDQYHFWSTGSRSVKLQESRNNKSGHGSPYIRAPPHFEDHFHIYNILIDQLVGCGGPKQWLGYCNTHARPFIF